MAYVRSPPGTEVVQLAAQEQRLLRWAATHGHQVVAVVRERHDGGQTVTDRRGIHDALAYIADRRAAGLLVEYVETLGLTVPVQEAALAMVWWHGGRILTSRRSDERGGLARRLLRELAAALLHLERGVESARAHRRRQRTLARGGRAGGAPPFGFQLRGGRLTTEPAEQLVLERIIELRRAGLSLRQLARVLDAEGHHPKRSERWHPESIRRILARVEAREPPRPGDDR